MVKKTQKKTQNSKSAAKKALVSDIFWPTYVAFGMSIVYTALGSWLLDNNNPFTLPISLAYLVGAIVLFMKLVKMRDRMTMFSFVCGFISILLFVTSGFVISILFVTSAISPLMS